MKKLLALVLAFVMVFSFAACGEKNDAKTALNKALTAIKNFDEEGIEKYFIDAELTEEDLKEEGADQSIAIFSTFSWKITSCEEEEDRAVAQVDLTCVSLADIMTKLVAEMMPKMLDGSLGEADVEAYTMKRFGELIKDSETKTVTQNIEFILEKVDGEWKVSNPETIMSVLTSGLEGIFGDEK